MDPLGTRWGREGIAFYFGLAIIRLTSADKKGGDLDICSTGAGHLTGPFSFLLAPFRRLVLDTIQRLENVASPDAIYRNNLLTLEKLGGDGWNRLTAQYTDEPGT
jgi:hypothetical protein